MSLPATQRVALFTPGTPRLPVVQQELPTLPEGYLLVKNTHAGINPIDYVFRDGFMPLPPAPTVLGLDVAGEVVAVGPPSQDAPHFEVGQRVFHHGNLFDGRTRAFQEYSIVPARFAIKTPSNISDAQAATIPLCLLTSFNALYHSKALNLLPPWDKDGETQGKGRSILITGGSSSVGQYGIQLARLSGFDEIITTSSSTHKEYLTSLGATAVLDRTASSQDVLAASRGKPVVCWLAITTVDSGKLALSVLKEALSSGQNPASDKAVLLPASKPLDASLVPEAAANVPPIEPYQVMSFSDHDDYRYITIPLVQHLTGWVESGQIKPTKVHLIEGGLEKVDEAIDINKKGVSGIKVVLKI